MKKKKDDFYYKNLNTCVEYSYQAACLLQETLADYQKPMLPECLSRMHEMEQQADSKKHKMMSVLSQAFITPIEREDLMALSNDLDDITDAVEEVLMQIYMCDVEDIREDILPMLELLKTCIQALGDVIGELKSFKHSKKLGEYIIRVNDLEERGDRLYMETMHRLHQESDIRTIVVWRTIYECVETCMDTCEHAADIVETVQMKNI